MANQELKDNEATENQEKKFKKAATHVAIAYYIFMVRVSFSLNQVSSNNRKRVPRSFKSRQNIQRKAETCEQANRRIRKRC